MLAEGRTPDESLFLTDADAIQIFRQPRSKTLQTCFKYRDYYHGLGRELDRDEELSHIPPRRKAGISMAFRSEATGQFMVALAAPVWSKDGTRVIGVLGRTIHLTNLLLQWEARIRESAGREERDGDFFLSLVDTREQPPVLLDHQWMTPAHLKPLKDNAKLKHMLQLDPHEFAEFRKQQVNPAYLDPLKEVDPQFLGEWLAACADVGGTGWVAIVQERRTKAVEPMAELYWLFFQYGAWMSVVFIAMLFLLWWIIQKVSQES